MILVDTNVVSETMRDAPDQRVTAWLHANAPESLFLSAVTAAELRSGVALMPLGKRQRVMEVKLELWIIPMFHDRVLAFDLYCTPAYADLLARLSRAGRPPSTNDALIAATALAHGLRVATRDTRPFRAAGISVIDPWLAD